MTHAAWNLILSSSIFKGYFQSSHFSSLSKVLGGCGGSGTQVILIIWIVASTRLHVGPILFPVYLLPPSETFHVIAFQFRPGESHPFLHLVLVNPFCSAFLNALAACPSQMVLQPTAWAARVGPSTLERPSWAAMVYTCLLSTLFAFISNKKILFSDPVSCLQMNPQKKKEKEEEAIVLRPKTWSRQTPSW